MVKIALGEREALEETTDGRRRRSHESRANIVRAMMEIIRNGEVFPSANEVAARAGVGLRTIYRHFDDMDSLYREIAVEVEAAITPQLTRPYDSDDWRGRIDEMIDRRADIYEAIAPFKIASNVKRFSSTFLRDDYDRFLRMEREALWSVLPKDITSDAELAAALRGVLSFQFWRSLRLDQKLSLKRTKAATHLTVNGLLSDQ